ncbi:Irregular chiasm C-roughest protein [Eumeta japonica]|uniref:Irregular chiasm C-roughest protein n=1 Tax=Eumeta variegata TaxID=151549 RepID=A0A4C1WCG9_EUMVA|nr:Irregular chiasm C-roughest protein [Eumeta japonica]
MSGRGDDGDKPRNPKTLIGLPSKSGGPLGRMLIASNRRRLKNTGHETSSPAARGAEILNNNPQKIECGHVDRWTVDMASLFGNRRTGGGENSSNTLRPHKKQIRWTKSFVFILLHIVSCCDGQQRFAMEPEDKTSSNGMEWNRNGNFSYCPSATPTGIGGLNQLLFLEIRRIVICASFSGSIQRLEYTADITLAVEIQWLSALPPNCKSAILGTDVILPCRVENKVGELQWTKDDFGMGTNRTLNGFPRYTMIGSDEESNYSLEIRNVSLEDDGIYQCQVSSGLDGREGQGLMTIVVIGAMANSGTDFLAWFSRHGAGGSPAIRSRYAQLTVIVAPDPPKILQGAFIDATADEPVVIECVSVGGKPAAEITWVDNRQNVITDSVKNIEELMPDGHRSIITLKPKERHHNQTFTCQAQNIADRAFRVASIHIEVKYRPKVKVTVKSGENGVTPEGTDARIGCSVEANPSAVSYQWYINRKAVIGDYAEELIIFNVSRDLNDATVKCEVTNKVGKGEGTATLEVAYPPSFISRPRNGAAAIGGTVTLSCDVDGHPEPRITWLHHEPGKIGAAAAARKIYEIEGEDTVNDRTAQRWFNRCDGGDLTLQHLSRSGRPPVRDIERVVSYCIDRKFKKLSETFMKPSLALDAKNKVKGKSNRLRVKVSNSTAGRYTCKASVDVEGYPEIEADAMIFIKGSPKIISNTTQFGIEGERAVVECSSVSFPKPDDIRWYFQGREISFLHDRDYASVEETMPDGTIRASLVIRASQPGHYGVYNCSVTNELGNDNIAIVFNPYRTLPVLLILVGVTSGLVIFSAFVVLVVLCYRRSRSNQQIGKKPDVTVTGDTYKESDRSSNISDLKVPHTDGTYELDYSNGSDNTIGSSMKLAGLPLAGPVALPNMRTDDPLMQFRYSNDYNDPTYNEYYKGPGYMSYPDYNQEYAPPTIRIQSPTQLDPSNNRSLQGSLTRSIDTASTVPLSSSQSSSLQRSNNPREESDAINNLGLPATAEAFSKGNRACEPTGSRKSPPPMKIRNSRSHHCIASPLARSRMSDREGNGQIERRMS